MMLCNPHNPVGTVYTRTELEKIGDFCSQNNLFICSDEIHAQLVIDGCEKHIPIASINADLSNRTVTLMSLNKVFNISGVGLGWCICSNPDIRKKIVRMVDHQSIYPNIIAYEATCAALDDGDAWRSELLEYLWGNQLLIRNWLRNRSDFFWALSPATYLAWLRCDKGYTQNQFLNNGVALMSGKDFGGDEYSNFFRLNYALPKQQLMKALSKIELACQAKN